MPPLQVPDDLPTTIITLQEPQTPRYQETADGDSPLGQEPPAQRNPPNAKKDRLADQRAIDLTVSPLEAGGWEMTADRQKNGVGYDLEFAKDSRRLNVEVKGIQGSKLVFNLTPK